PWLDPIQLPGPLRPERLGVRGRTCVDSRIRRVRLLAKLRRWHEPPFLAQQRFQRPLDFGHGPLTFSVSVTIPLIIRTRPPPEQRRLCTHDAGTPGGVRGVSHGSGRGPKPDRTRSRKQLRDNTLPAHRARPRRDRRLVLFTPLA